MNHSLLPWQYEPESDNEASYPFDDTDNCAGSIISEDTDGSYIARIWADGNMPADDAKFICLAVNHFEELVKALSECVGSLREYHAMSTPPVKGRLGKELRVAEALLAKLEEKV